MKRICVICGREYEPFFQSASRQKTCGAAACIKIYTRKLAREYQRRKRLKQQVLLEPKACLICAKIFQPKSARQKTCGERACVVRNSSRRKRKMPRLNYPPRQCVICGKEFVPSYKNSKLCGDPACKVANAREYQRRCYAARQGSQVRHSGCPGIKRVYDAGLNLELYACAKLSLKSLSNPCKTCMFHGEH